MYSFYHKSQESRLLDVFEKALVLSFYELNALLLVSFLYPLLEIISIINLC